MIVFDGSQMSELLTIFTSVAIGMGAHFDAFDDAVRAGGL
jgi:hypothetical protein